MDQYTGEVATRPGSWIERRIIRVVDAKKDVDGFVDHETVRDHEQESILEGLRIPFLEYPSGCQGYLPHPGEKEIRGGLESPAK
jgi:hypothetical protein